MGWSIRRRKGLLGGLVNLNLSKSGLGVSVGVKGARVGVNAKGQTYSQVSIPGTGIYNRSYHAASRATRKCLLMRSDVLIVAHRLLARERPALSAESPLRARHLQHRLLLQLPCALSRANPLQLSLVLSLY